ncbi:MAG: cytochrome c [Gammaproteobacteria bacterium]|nr:cytochrome c [Gammaproteobacteria bacterium]
MNQRQARLFAIACTGIAALAFLGLTVDSHRQFPELTNADAITPEVSAGQDVWHKYNCVNCHTLFGEGAYYAPDLTKIADLRGEPYLQAYMRDPAQFYDEQRHRRLMPNQNLSEEEITNLIRFLQWVADVDTQGWPPRPILVATGFAPPSREAVAADQPGVEQVELRPVTPESDPRAIGENLFRSVTPACNACHSLTEGMDMAGPTLAGIRTRAEAIVGSDDYDGDADDAEGYIRESITDPSAHIVPGQMYSANDMSFMPNTYADSLSEEQIDQLAAFLASYE